MTEPEDPKPESPEPDDSRTKTFELKSDSTLHVSNSDPGFASDGTEDPKQVGRYRIVRTLGRGSFGSVYLAVDELLDRQVAVKIPHARVAAAEGNCRKQVNEAKAIAKVRHAAIVAVFDVSQLENGTPFVVSDYIDGQNLAEVAKERSLSVPEILKVVSTVAEALHAAHLQGMVHRDIKPANILMDVNGNAFVTDFGLALHESELDTDSSYAGSVSYMSPEQAGGRSSMVDGRSDIFSLGIVLYELLTDRLPFGADSITDLLDRIVKQDARPLRQYKETIPKNVERICLKALAKSPLERYATAKDFARDLAECITYSPEPIDVSHVNLPDHLKSLVEELAKHTHDTWATARIEEGWSWGDERDDRAKIHPDLIPYELLTEGEKEYDRKTVLSTILALLAKGYRIEKGDSNS